MKPRIVGPLCGVVLLAILLCLFALDAIGQQPERESETASSSAVTSAKPGINPRWLQKVPLEDRQAVESLIGYAPPDFTDDLDWIGNDPLTWDDLHGRVVVVQSWTSARTIGKKRLGQTCETLDHFDSDDVHILALHTPEQAENAEAYLERNAVPDGVSAIVDSSGKFCDSLGIYKLPVNFIVDRNGTVRAAGLNHTGLEEATTVFASEPFNEKAAAKTRKRDSIETGSAQFPPLEGFFRSAQDIRGQKAPELYVEEWVTESPNADGKVVVLDFWATWCGPCIRSIPHMNQLAAKFRDDAVFIGISDESSEAFENGLKRRKLPLNSFKYPLARDSSARMKRAIQIRGIPHCIIMSSDWIVRWQGNPLYLREETVQQIIDANQPVAANSVMRTRRGWTTG